MAAPSQMGQDDAAILVSGPSALYARAQPLLRMLGGALFHAELLRGEARHDAEVA